MHAWYALTCMVCSHPLLDWRLVQRQDTASALVKALCLAPQVHFFKDFDSSEKFRITGRHENSMLPSHFQVPHMQFANVCAHALLARRAGYHWLWTCTAGQEAAHLQPEQQQRICGSSQRRLRALGASAVQRHRQAGVTI